MSTFMDAFVGHDWTGVFVTGAPEGEPYIVLTACHHDDNAFYNLGIIRHEATPEQMLAALTTEPPHDCQDPEVDVCWMLDFHDANGDVYDDREISEQAARAILDGDLDEALATGRANHEAWVDHPVHEAA